MANKKKNKKTKVNNNISKTSKQQGLPIKENNIVSSRVIKNEKLYKLNNPKQEKPKFESEADLMITKQQKFDFDSLNIDDDLDTSFLEKPPKKVKIEQVPPINSTKKKNSKVTIVFLLLIIVCQLSFCIYHFITFDHHKIEKKVQKIKVDENYVFLGDSITDGYDLNKYFKGLPVVNSGINGNETTDILADMNNRVYKYNPTSVILLIGTNDIYKNRNMDEIIDNIKKIVDEIKKKKKYCKIYLESIYPVNDTDDEKINHNLVGARTNNYIKKINKKLKQYALKENRVIYIDVYNKLVNDEGNLNIEYTKEGLHLNDSGYEVVTKLLKKEIFKDK